MLSGSFCVRVTNSSARWMAASSDDTPASWSACIHMPTLLRSGRPCRPYDTPPKLLNPGEIRALLQRDYPAALREARVEGKVIIWAYVDIDGRVAEARVQQSSGFAEMDRTALDVAREMRFSPALNRDKKTPVWVQQAIVFQTRTR